MKPVEFPQQTAIIAKDQAPYLPFPCYRAADEGHENEDGHIIACWQLTWQERWQAMWHGKIWHHVLTFNKPLQPQLLATESPWKA